MHLSQSKNRAVIEGCGPMLAATSVLQPYSIASRPFYWQPVRQTRALLHPRQAGFARRMGQEFPQQWTIRYTLFYFMLMSSR